MAKHARSFWEQRVADVERCGSVEDVAHRHGVKPITLRWWRSQLRREQAESPMLLPVVVRSGAAPTSGAALEIAIGGAVMRVAVGTDVEYVAALIGAVSRR